LCFFFACQPGAAAVVVTRRSANQDVRSNARAVREKLASRPAGRMEADGPRATAPARRTVLEGNADPIQSAENPAANVVISHPARTQAFVFATSWNAAARVAQKMLFALMMSAAFRTVAFVSVDRTRNAGSIAVPARTMPRALMRVRASAISLSARELAVNKEPSVKPARVACQIARKGIAVLIRFAMCPAASVARTNTATSKASATVRS